MAVINTAYVSRNHNKASPPLPVAQGMAAARDSRRPGVRLRCAESRGRLMNGAHSRASHEAMPAGRGAGVQQAIQSSSSRLGAYIYI